VLYVAGAAAACESDFFGVVCGSIVALQAGIIADLLVEKPQSAGMTEIAVLAQHGVGRGELAAAKNFLAVGARRGEPCEGYDRNRDRQPEPPTAEGMGALEILEVHPLGQVLGGAYAARHSLFQCFIR
jgi:hypothetical protein